MPQTEKKYSLAVLFFIIFALIVVINFFLVYASTLQHRQELIQLQLIEKLRLLEVIEKIIFSPTIQQTENAQEITTLLIAEFAQTKDIVFIRVANQSGKIEMSSERKDRGEQINIDEGVKEMLKKQKYMLVEELYEQASIFTVIYSAGEKFLFLGFSTAAIEAPVATMQKNNIFIALAGSMFSVLFLLLFFKTVVSPLRKIQASCEEIQAGNWDTKIEIKSKNEIGALAATFNAMLKQLRNSREREKLIERMKTEFVSLTAHQLRTPLSAIKWSLGMVLEEEMGQLTTEQKNLLQKTYQSNERMIYLINDLLNVARIEEGKFLYRLSPARLEEITKSVVENIEQKIKFKNIDFRLQKPARGLPTIKADVEKIEVAIYNLLNNAINYTPVGGQITIALSKYGAEEVLFRIQDTGVGIPKDEQKQIFLKFFRGSNVRRGEVSGTGLGMFITKNIIEAHGGKIWFESEENKGTTFYFTLPISK